jgi:hypothetical protein
MQVGSNRPSAPGARGSGRLPGVRVRSVVGRFGRVCARVCARRDLARRQSGRRPITVRSPIGSCSPPNDDPTVATTPCSFRRAGMRLVSIITLSCRSSSRRQDPSSFRTNVVICRTNRSGEGADVRVTMAQSSPTQPKWPARCGLLRTRCRRCQARARRRAGVPQRPL